MIILANDGIAKSAEERLVSLGFEVDTNKYEGADLDARIKEVDCIIIRSATKLRVPQIDAAVGGNLKLMIRAGVGLDNIDVKYAEEKGFIVRNTPTASSDAVAECAIAHMFAVARHIHISNHTMRNGEWNKKAYKGIELAGKTLGLVGFGRIAQATARRAVALGMNVQFFDLVKDIKTDFASKYVEMDELLATSDFISLHVPGGNLIGAEEIAKCKDGVYIINTARGGVVNEEALLAGLDSGKVAGAGIDVFEQEPTPNKALYTHPKISMTPHIGAQTAEAQDRIGDVIVELCNEILK